RRAARYGSRLPVGAGPRWNGIPAHTGAEPGGGGGDAGMNGDVVLLAPDDDVAVALRGCDEGTSLAVPGREPVVARHSVPSGHKVALRRIAAGEFVRKYGQVIGVATRTVTVGEHVPLHNLAMPDGVSALASESTVTEGPHAPIDLRRTVDGTIRPDGAWATRHYGRTRTSAHDAA